MKSSITIQKWTNLHAIRPNLKFSLFYVVTGRMIPSIIDRFEKKEQKQIRCFFPCYAFRLWFIEN